jgi:hypothetical protein
MATGSDPEHQGGEGAHREVVGGPLLVARGDAAALLEAADEPLHPVPLAVHGAVDGAVPVVAGPLVAPARDDGLDVPLRERPE